MYQPSPLSWEFTLRMLKGLGFGHAPGPNLFFDLTGDNILKARAWGDLPVGSQSSLEPASLGQTKRIYLAPAGLSC